MIERFRWFYRMEEKTQHMIPSVCACLIEREDGEVGGIGLAICSGSDNPSYKRGRAIARNRARHAFDSDNCSLPIGRDEALYTMALTIIPEKPILVKAIPSGTEFFGKMREGFWPPREKTGREGHEESKKESIEKRASNKPS